MDRRVLVGAGLVAAALIAAVAWFVPSDGVTAPISAPPTVVKPDPAPPRPRARVAAADTTTEDDAPPGDDGRPIRVSGVVMDDAGAKVPGATVTAWRMLRGRRTDVVETTSDADGRFVLPPVAKASRLVAAAPGRRSVEERLGISDTQIVLTVQAHRVIRGRLVRRDHPSIPAAGVPVRGPRGEIVLSDAAGRWAFDVIGIGSAECAVAPREEPGSAEWESLAVSVADVTEEFEIPVTRWMTLRGRIIGENGEGVVAECRWRASEQDDADRTGAQHHGVTVSRIRAAYSAVTSGPDGNFEFGRVDSGRGTLRVLAPLAAATGTVEDRARSLRAAGGRWTWGVRAVRNLDLRPAVPGATGAEGSDRVVEVLREADSTSPPIERVLERVEISLAALTTVSGRVIGPPEVIAGTTIVARDGGGWTIGHGAACSEDGNFEITDVPCDRKLTLSLVGLQPEWKMDERCVVEPGQRDMEIRVVSALIEFRATLLDSSGRPVPGRAVEPDFAMQRRWYGNCVDAGSLTDRDGRVTFRGVRDKVFDVWSEGIRVGQCSPGSQPTLRLPELHRVAGTVRIADRRPLPEVVWVEIENTNVMVARRVHDGRFEFAGVPAGVRTIRVCVGRPRTPEPDDEPDAHTIDAGSSSVGVLDDNPRVANFQRGWRHDEVLLREVEIPCSEIELVIPEPKPR